MCDRLQPTRGAAGRSDWGRRPRWLVLPVALPCFLVFGLAVGTLVNLGLTGAGLQGQGSGLVKPASAATADQAAGVPPEACGQIQYIVDTACSLQQYDPEPPALRLCAAPPPKYTPVSATRRLHNPFVLAWPH